MTDINTYEVLFYVGGLREWAANFSLNPPSGERYPENIAKLVADRMRSKLEGSPPVIAQSGVRVRVHVEASSNRPTSMTREEMRESGWKAARFVAHQLGLPLEFADDSSRYEGHYVCTAQR